jgi:hypothetical protein
MPTEIPFPEKCQAISDLANSLGVNITSIISDDTQTSQTIHIKNMSSSDVLNHVKGHSDIINHLLNKLAGE